MDQVTGHEIGHNGQECVLRKLLSESSMWRYKIGIYERRKKGMGPCANEVKCDVVKWLKRNNLWFGNLERKKSEELVKKVYVSSRGRRRPVVRWKDKVKEYMYESVAMHIFLVGL